jgi:hypothetical protein
MSNTHKEEKMETGSLFEDADSACPSLIALPIKPKRKSDREGVAAYALATGFASWWGGVYPCTGAVVNAQRAWVFDLSESDRLGICDATRDYLLRRAQARQAGLHVADLPHGGTFLRQQRWNQQWEVVDPPGFDSFFGQYPRNESRLEAAKIWATLTEDQRCMLVSNLPAWIEHWRGRERYTPSAKKWIVDQLGASKQHGYDPPKSNGKIYKSGRPDTEFDKF